MEPQNFLLYAYVFLQLYKVFEKQKLNKAVKTLIVLSIFAFITARIINRKTTNDNDDSSQLKVKEEAEEED